MISKLFSVALDKYCCYTFIKEKLRVGYRIYTNNLRKSFLFPYFGVQYGANIFGKK